MLSFKKNICISPKCKEPILQQLYEPGTFWQAVPGLNPSLSQGQAQEQQA